MFFPESQVRVWLYNRPTDIRNSYNGLWAVVRLYLIVAETSAKCCILNVAVTVSGVNGWSRVSFTPMPAGQAVKQLLALTDLKLIIDGIDTRSIRYHKSYVKADASNSKTAE